ncbi:MAG: hypothetical protein JJ916_14760 [Phycisphaerales bacterium]|nr:hypothetical protein [Phycisphaerales bacterium]
MTSPESRAIRHMYRTDPRMFMQLAFRLMHPGICYQHNWSIDVLGEALARCHRREATRLIINMPPRSLKSVCASIAFPAWIHGVQPDQKILCISGHRGLADEHHHQAHRLMTHERYRGLFPHVRVSESPGRLKLPQGGVRLALTPSGAVTGKGADMIIIDDPQTPQQAEESAKCAEIRSWYDRNIYQRLNDKHDGVIIVVTQRLSIDDLTAHLLKQDGWEVLSLPAIATRDEYLPQSLGGVMARRKGEALHPARESREDLRAEMLRMGARAFCAQYQQDPYPVRHHRGGVYHTSPHTDGTEAEHKNSAVFFAQLPEELFVLDCMFGEQNSFRAGPAPMMSTEEWIERHGGMQINRTA